MGMRLGGFEHLHISDFFMHRPRGLAGSLFGRIDQPELDGVYRKFRAYLVDDGFRSKGSGRRTGRSVRTRLLGVYHNVDPLDQSVVDFVLREHCAAAGRYWRTGKRSGVQFRVVEPPNLPAKPDGPDRQLYNFGGLLGGIGAGIVFAVMVSFLLPTFGSPEALVQSFQRPVLGVITTIPQQSKRWLRTAESLGFVSLFGGLFGLFFIVLSGVGRNFLNLTFQGWQI